ncbi:MAG: hypothetical protein ACK55H_09375 [Cyanobacteriota bacterium]|jgi:hypothetical protein
MNLPLLLALGLPLLLLVLATELLIRNGQHLPAALQPLAANRGRLVATLWGTILLLSLLRHLLHR